MNSPEIRFNFPYLAGNELAYIDDVMRLGRLSGDGHYSRQCESWLERKLESKKALLTHSCTAALEMAAILCDIQPGDEIIMPSYTFVSTANAFVLRGGVPVFIDIREDTLNIDENKIEDAITEKTKAIVPVHYAGVACEMGKIMEVARQYNLLVIEDAAQGILSKYRGRPLGSIGDLGCLSFHETKNIISGEGGALLINDERLIERAEVIREKGTNRSQFFRDEVDKYTWVDVGSSYLPSELTAAFLFAQMESADQITERRLAIWERYDKALESHERKGMLRRPIVPVFCSHNAHMYYVLMPNIERRSEIIEEMKKKHIRAVFHYVPLHSSPAGKMYARAHDSLRNTDAIAERLVRLPLWCGMEDQIDKVITGIKGLLE